MKNNKLDLTSTVLLLSKSHPSGPQMNTNIPKNYIEKRSILLITYRPSHATIATKCPGFTYSANLHSQSLNPAQKHKRALMVK